jgi:hypothetical protein
MVLSLAASAVLLWAAGIRDFRQFLFSSLLYFPITFLILSVLVRVAPFVVPPRLYIGKPPSVITKLDLSP